jgi:hypothetical protein
VGTGSLSERARGGAIFVLGVVMIGYSVFARHEAVWFRVFAFPIPGLSPAYYGAHVFLRRRRLVALMDSRAAEAKRAFYCG